MNAFLLICTCIILQLNTVLSQGSGAGVGVGSTTPGTGEGTTAAFGGTGAQTGKLGTKAIIFICVAIACIILPCICCCILHCKATPKRRKQPNADPESGEKVTSVYESVPTEPAPIHLPQKKNAFSIFNKKRPS